ncbi:hypothetical protein [Bacillus sp. EAC]|uniref:hypothetical protein n=1 Tax=Bacillus sp. EAC TaxID=1978338 RepID=UPI00211B5836|nr:hypothetical protein [Bacillus sp. EAC]
MNRLIEFLKWFIVLFIGNLIGNAIFKENLNILTAFSTALGASLGITGLGFFRKNKLIKDDLNGLAKLMYQDVSADVWDKENLTKSNLDFSIESIRYIDLYSTRLMNTETGTELLNEHFDSLVVRIGAYIGEVIKKNIKQDFYWYEYDSVYNYSSKLDGVHRSNKPTSLLYSKKREIVILPIYEVSQFLEGNSTYPNLKSYVEEMIRENS